MAKLIFGMMQSLDGYVASVGGELQFGPPENDLARHLNDHVRSLAGMILGRRMYEVMCYWDQDQPGWDDGDREFAAMWRRKPKWVASRTLKAVGPNATLIKGDVSAFVRKMKEDAKGEISVAGPELAGSLTTSGLIDEYRLYFRPFVLGRGKPFFAGPVPGLHLVGTEQIGDAVMAKYVVKAV